VVTGTGWARKRAVLSRKGPPAPGKVGPGLGVSLPLESLVENGRPGDLEKSRAAPGNASAE
jgi:hypothetical protein